jgi:hypothetical protein
MSPPIKIAIEKAVMPGDLKVRIFFHRYGSFITKIAHI